MQTRLSGPLLQSAKLFPPLTKAGLLVASRIFRHPHWTLARIATELDCRIKVKGKLGNGMTLDVFWADVVGTGILVNGYHEPGTVSVVQNFLKPGMVFFDLGAQVGQYTLVAAGLVGAKGCVCSFEPDPNSFPVLRDNVAANELSNVHLSSCAVGSDSGTALLYAGSAQNIGTASLQQGEHSTGSTLVNCISIDAFMEKENIDRVDLIKIDVEGAELDVLHGASKLFSSSQRPHFIIEFAEANQRRFGRSYEQLAAFLMACDYELFCICKDGRMLPYKPWGPEHPYFNVSARPREAEISRFHG